MDGLRDVMTNEVNGLLVPPRDPEALARAILRVLGDERLSKRLSEEALASSHRFDIQVFVDKMSQLYELLVERYRQVRFGRPRWDYENDFRFLEENGEH